MKNLANFWNENRIDLQFLLACLMCMVATSFYMGVQQGIREAEQQHNVDRYCATAHPIESLCRGSL